MSAPVDVLPLTNAVICDNQDEVKRLLTEAEFLAEGEGGAAQLVNTKDPKNFNMTALHEACYSNQIEMVRILLADYSHARAARGTASGYIDGDGNTHIISNENTSDAAAGGGSAAAGQRDAEEEGGAGGNDDRGSDRASVGGGGGENVDLDLQDVHGWTPLMCTVINNYLEIFKLLMEHGASVDIQNNDGSTALTLAAEKNHGEATEMVSILIEHGAQLDLQETGKQSATALILSAINNHREIFEMLVNNGAVIDLQDKSGRSALYCLCDNSWTALMVAATDNRVVMVEQLLKAGANPNLPDVEGETPVQVATKWGHPEVVELLVKYGGIAAEGAVEEAKERQANQRSVADDLHAEAVIEVHKVWEDFQVKLHDGAFEEMDKAMAAVEAAEAAEKGEEKEDLTNAEEKKE